MNQHELDDRLRQLYSEQRDADQQRAPSFEQSWWTAMQRASEPAPRPWAVPVAAGLLATVLVAAATMFWQRHPARNESKATAMVSITEWVSPTDFLLEPLTDTSFSVWQP